MRKFSIILAALFLVATSQNLFGQSRNANKFLLFIGQDKQSILDYFDQVGAAPDGVMAYTSIQNLEGLTEPHDSGAGIQYLEYFRKEFPRLRFQIGLYMVDVLDGVIKGQYDENIRRLADWLKKADVPVFLRIGYEFDGPHNHYDPQKYIAAYRHIVDALNSLEVKNVSFVWHSYGGYVEGDRMRWYPGSSYVDWVAVSYFNAYNKSDMEKISKIAKQENKPFMIAEATPKGFDLSSNEKAWSLWFEKLFSFIEKENVKAVCYINTNWENSLMFRGQNWGDSRIQVNSIIREKWLRKIK